jgi:hypothetical protein
MFAQCEYPIYTLLGSREIAQFFGRYLHWIHLENNSLTLFQAHCTLLWQTTHWNHTLHAQRLGSIKWNVRGTSWADYDSVFEHRKPCAHPRAFDAPLDETYFAMCVPEYSPEILESRLVVMTSNEGHIQLQILKFRFRKSPGNQIVSNWAISKSVVACGPASNLLQSRYRTSPSNRSRCDAFLVSFLANGYKRHAAKIVATCDVLVLWDATIFCNKFARWLQKIVACDDAICWFFWDATIFL